MQRATEIDHPLGFSKAKCAMNGMRRGVLERGIGRQLGAARSSGPRLDRRDESTRHTAATRSGLDVQALKKCNRRTIRAVNVVPAFGRLNEAHCRTVRANRQANEVPASDSIAHVTLVLGLGAIRPQARA